MPDSSITAEKNHIVGILLREFFEKDVHADRIAAGHDQKAGTSCKRFHGTIYIPVLTNMAARHRWTDAFPAPAVFGLVNPPKASLILKHETEKVHIPYLLLL